MICSRREVAGLLPLIAVATAEAEKPALPSGAYRFEDLPVKESGANRSRAVFDGATHSGFHIDMHMTELGPGEAPHAPHSHVHEEMVMIKDGTLEVTINGKVTRLGPGSTAYVASNERHGWRNAGQGRALYFVLALGREVA